MSQNTMVQTKKEFLTMLSKTIHIGVYKNGTGEPITSATGPTIKEVVEKLNQQPQTNGQNNGENKG